MAYLYIGIASLAALTIERFGLVLYERKLHQFKITCEKLAFRLGESWRLPILEDLLDRILAGSSDPEALERFERDFIKRKSGYIPSSNLKERYEAAQRLVALEHEFDSVVPPLVERQPGLAQLPFEEQLGGLRRLASSIRGLSGEIRGRAIKAVGMSDEQAIEEHNRILADRLQELLADLNREPSEAALLRVEEYFSWQKEFYKHYSVDGFKLPKRPANWNKLVAEHVRAPVVDQFVGDLVRSRSSAELALMAAKAIEESDIIAIKYCLAMCHTTDAKGLRGHISPERVDLLADLVVAYHARRATDTAKS